MEEERKEGTFPLEKEALQSWTSPPILPNIDDFALMHDKYPRCIVTIYQIIRDLHVKQEVCNIEIIDASKWGENEYFIQGKTKSTGWQRLMIPVYLDADIDLPRLQNLAADCKMNETELYICVHTPETIIYELITADLP